MNPAHAELLRKAMVLSMATWLAVDLLTAESRRRRRELAQLRADIDALKHRYARSL